MVDELGCGKPLRNLGILLARPQRAALRFGMRSA